MIFLSLLWVAGLQIFFTADKNCCGRLEWEGEGWSLTWNSNRGHKSFRNTNLCHTWTRIGMSCTTISYLDGVGEAGGHRTTLYHQTIGHKMEKNYLHQSLLKISVMSSVEVKLDKVERCLARYSPRAEANNAIPCNNVRYNTIPCNTDTTWKLCDTIRYKAIPCSTIRCHAIQWKA